jgi:hypothetical protein
LGSCPQAGALLVFDTRLIQVYTFLVRTFLGSARCDDKDDKGEKHDLSHGVFYHENDYSLFRPIGGMDCKDAVYTPLHREKAANSGGGIYLKYEADLKVGRHLREYSIEPSTEK